MVGVRVLVVAALLAHVLVAWARDAAAVHSIDSMITAGEKVYHDGKYLEAIECFLRSGKRAEKAGLPDLHCLALYNMGVCYFLISENGEALKNYQQAYGICTANGLGWQTRSRIQNGIAGVYFEEHNYVKAREVAVKCYDEALDKRDSSLVSVYALDLALIANKEKKFGESAKFLASARRHSTNIAADMSRILAIEAEAMFMQGRHDRVTAIASRLLADSCASEADKGIVMIYLIDIYTQRRQLRRAFAYAGEAERMVTLKNKPYLFETVARLHEAAGDFRQALACKDSVIMYNDSLTRIANRRLAESSRIRLEVTRLNAEMDRQTARVRQSHRVTLLVLCISVLLVVIGVIVVYVLRVRNRHEREVMELRLETEQQEKLLAERQMREVEMEARYRQEMMTRSLEQKKKELSATTMFISSRNELIEDLLKYLAGIKEAQGIPALNDLVQHLRQLLKSSNERDNFLVNFEAANPDFIRSLKALHLVLSSSDIRFLAYIRMNMSTKDIASLANINPESCKRRKIRISKKLGLESSSELYGYILGI